MSLTDFKRLPERGSHARELIYSILDATLVGHVGFVRQGQPAVIPTLVVRRGDRAYIHGSPASAAIRAGRAGADLCLTVTQIDGLVLARSAFHHSANYRSVVVYASGRWVEGAEKLAVLDALVDKIAPGRRDHLRPMTRNETAGTGVVALDLDQASAKVRTGPPGDDEADYDLPIWAGVVPLETRAGPPIPDPRNLPDLPVPEHVQALSR